MSSRVHFSRRFVVTGLLATGVAGISGCSQTAGKGTKTSGSSMLAGKKFTSSYGPRSDGGFKIPAVPIDKIDPRYVRQVVRNITGEKPGTLVVDTSKHFLYYTMPNGKAMRYGVGLGRAGFAWSGRAVVQWKKKWPHWKPPAEMIERQPELAKYSVENGGMPPGLANPLGARALYIFKDGEDTLFRLHGTPKWNSIGKSVSSGCVRLMNQDIIDLYSRVRNGTPIRVTNGLSGMSLANVRTIFKRK